MPSYNPIYRRYIDESKIGNPNSMVRGKFYLIKQYEYVDGTKGNYTANNSPIIYTLFVSKAKDIVHAVKVSNVHPQLIKRFFGAFVNEDEAKLELKGGAKKFYSTVVSRIPIVTSEAYRTYKLSGFGRIVELEMDINKITPKNNKK
jgi:hypothetical protein